MKTPTVRKKSLKIITPEQFDVIYEAIAEPILKLLAETDIETGLRWGELTELRVKDLGRITRVLTISRAVVQVDPKFHPEGGRFLVKEYPKDGEYRSLKLSAQLASKISSHISDVGLGPEDLIFPMPPQDSPAARLRAVPNLAALGFTKPNAIGRQYRHGTMSGYNAGKCRCSGRGSKGVRSMGTGLARSTASGRNLRAVIPGLRVIRPRDGENRERRYVGLSVSYNYIGADRGPRTIADRGT